MAEEESCHEKEETSKLLLIFILKCFGNKGHLVTPLFTDLFDADALENDGSRVLVMLALVLLLLVDHIPLKDLEALT